jgi:hypothetical protein
MLQQPEHTRGLLCMPVNPVGMIAEHFASYLQQLQVWTVAFTIY